MTDNPYILDILSQPSALLTALQHFDPAPLGPFAAALQKGDFDWIVLTGMGGSLFASYPLWLTLASPIVVYYSKTYLGRGEEVSYVLGTLLIAQVFSLPVFQWLSRRTSRPRTYLLAASIFVVVMFFSFLFTPTSPAPALYVFAALVGIGSGGVVIMIYAIFPDIPDVDELRSGERREGTYSALTTFTRKLSSALAIFAVAQVLQFAGYIPPIQQAGQLIEAPQTPTFITALRLFLVFIPVVFISFGIFFASRFPLTVDFYRRLEEVLAAMRGGNEVNAQERQELIER